MERAAYLLHDSKLKLADITDQVGYTSSSYFIRTFRRTFGMTPMEYRNRLKGKKQ
ncbi:MAG: AraC family transcriptional regulator [Eisenbergiella massiliensis]